MFGSGWIGVGVGGGVGGGGGGGVGGGVGVELLKSRITNFRAGSSYESWPIFMLNWRNQRIASGAAAAAALVPFGSALESCKKSSLDSL
jgi:hypothetical protein